MMTSLDFHDFDFLLQVLFKEIETRGKSKISSFISAFAVGVNQGN